jgi:hypothetical protein
MIIEIDYKQIDLEVEFNYIPEEPMVMYHKDGSGDPGSASEAEILRVLIGDIDIYDLVEDQIEKIEQLVLESYENEER